MMGQVPVIVLGAAAFAVPFFVRRPAANIIIAGLVMAAAAVSAGYGAGSSSIMEAASVVALGLGVAGMAVALRYVLRSRDVLEVAGSAVGGAIMYMTALWLMLVAGMPTTVLVAFLGAAMMLLLGEFILYMMKYIAQSM